MQFAFMLLLLLHHFMLVMLRMHDDATQCDAEVNVIPI